jgi:uncharacterized protein involved in exopolysaccharide biosynthesis
MSSTDSHATTIDLGTARDAVAAGRGRILALAVVAGLAGAGWAASRPDPSLVEARVQLSAPAATARAATTDAAEAEGEGTPAPTVDERLIAAQLELFGSPDFLDRVAASDDDADPRATARDDRMRQRRAGLLRDHLVVRRAAEPGRLVFEIRTTETDTARRLLEGLHRRHLAVLAEDAARVRADVERGFALELGTARAAAVEARTLAAATTGSTPMPLEKADRLSLAAERHEAEQTVERLRKLAASGDVERAMDSAATPMLARLRDRRAALRARIAELSVTYLEKHPLLKDANEQMAALRAEAKAELPRALAARKAALAEIDRRIADLAAETTAGIPAATPNPAADPAAAADAAVAAVAARRDAAVAEALARETVEARLIEPPVVAEGPSPLRPLIWGAACAVAGLFLGFLVVALRGARRPLVERADLEPTFDAAVDLGDVAPDEAMPIAEAPAPPAIAETPEQPAPPAVFAAPRRGPVSDLLDLEPRAIAYERLASGLVGGMRRRMVAEIGRRGRIVVVSTSDAARSLGAARALAADIARSGATVGLVEELALADLVDGRTGCTAAIRPDPATGVWVLSGATRRMRDAELETVRTATLLDALADTWDDLVIDAGRLAAGPGMAALIASADAVILAEDASDDPRALAAFDGLDAAGRSVWLLDPPVATASARRPLAA